MTQAATSGELLRQVRLLDPLSQTDRVTDVLIEAGTVQAIGSPLEADLPDLTIHDCTGLVLGPGLVDLYSHSGEPGNESRETLASLQAAAAAGGFTRLTLLPDTQPALDHSASVSWIRKAAQTGPALHCWGALTQGVQGEQMGELLELAEAEIAGFADGRPLQNRALLRRILDYGQVLNQPIALWCCDLALVGAGVIREGSESLRLGLPGIPVMAEAAPLAYLLECIAELGTPVHIMRVSTARAVELIREAKARGLPVTASTTWMHLLLDVTAVQSYDPSLHLDPPLGNPSDRLALLTGLQTGVIDAIAIDHSPYTYEEKTVAFAESPPGAIGLELALPLLWQSLVASGQWTALELWQRLSTAPARLLNQTPPLVAVGEQAELVLFDPNESWPVTPATLNSQASNTPWLHQAIQGRVLQIWC
ncbi:MAG: dihydroorotase [Elainella sp.]